MKAWCVLLPLVSGTQLVETCVDDHCDAQSLLQTVSRVHTAAATELWETQQVDPSPPFGMPMLYVQEFERVSSGSGRCVGEQTSKLPIDVQGFIRQVVGPYLGVDELSCEGSCCTFEIPEGSRTVLVSVKLERCMFSVFENQANCEGEGAEPWFGSDVNREARCQRDPSGTGKLPVCVTDPPSPPLGMQTLFVREFERVSSGSGRCVGEQTSELPIDVQGAISQVVGPYLGVDELSCEGSCCTFEIPEGSRIVPVSVKLERCMLSVFENQANCEGEGAEPWFGSDINREARCKRDPSGTGKLPVCWHW